MPPELFRDGTHLVWRCSLNARHLFTGMWPVSVTENQLRLEGVMNRRIDAYSLRLFVATATEGSIARGAAKEHIAASALSRRISDLEHALGVALFVRSPRGIELTNA